VRVGEICREGAVRDQSLVGVELVGPIAAVVVLAIVVVRDRHCRSNSHSYGRE
jgi:hypothetical protein